MKSLNFTIICFCILLCTSLIYGIDLKPKIDKIAKPLIKDKIIVGMIIGIVKDGKKQIFSYGEIKKGSGISPDGDTVYEIGSISKVFTGILLADSIQKNLVKLDDPIQKHLPPTIKVPIHSKQPILLVHLATHRSGLTRMPSNFYPSNPMNPYADYTVKNMYDFLNGHKLRREPGIFEYSNYGMGLLGHILALKQKTSYEQILIKDICNPLNMNDTRIKLSKKMKKNLATPYNKVQFQMQNWDLPTLAGAGGIRSTCNDMIKFIEANLKKGDDQISKSLSIARQKQQNLKNNPAMGLNWFIARDGITRLHGGMTGGYCSYMAVAPSLNAGVIVLANTAHQRINGVAEQIKRIALGTQQKEIYINPAILRKYIGRYAITPDIILSITIENNKLMIQTTGQGKGPIFAMSKTEFFLKVVDAQVTFIVEKDGSVKKLILHQHGQDMEGKRIK